MSNLDELRALLDKLTDMEAMGDIPGQFATRMYYLDHTKHEIGDKAVVIRKLLAVAEAARVVVERAYHMSYRTDGVHGVECRHCGAWNVDERDITHKPDCPLAALQTALAALPTEPEAPIQS